MKQKIFFTLAAWLFLVIAVLHALRIFKGWDVTIGDMALSTKVSWGIVFVAGYLSYFGFKYSR